MRLYSTALGRWRFILIPWCWFCGKLDRCDWCFTKLSRRPEEENDWEWCEKCRWYPGLPTRWEA